MGKSTTPVTFITDPLAAASSGDFTSLVYQCSEKNKEGMIWGFYGSYWNNAGVVFQGFGFKDLPKENALELLNLFKKNITEF